MRQLRRHERHGVWALLALAGAGALAVAIDPAQKAVEPATGAAAPLSPELKVLAQEIIQNGWQGADAETALAVALAESGGRRRAVSPNGLWYGFWQLAIGPHNLSPEQAFDIGFATRFARELWEREGWRPWGAHRKRRHLKMLPLARQIMLEAARPELRPAAEV